MTNHYKKMMNRLRNFILNHTVFLPLLAALLVCLLLVFLVAFFAVDDQRMRTQATATAILYNPFAEVEVSAEAAVVYDIAADRVLYAKNADSPLPLASITKLMLAVVVAETLSPDGNVGISENALAQDGESGLLLGDTWRVQDLLDYTLIVSSNDGAEALAEASGEVLRRKYSDAPAYAVEATVWRMNQKAKELGLSQTYFLDAHGLDESSAMAGAYGSARDMGILFAYAAAHALDAISATTYDYTSLGEEHGSLLPARNTNDALGTIPGLIAGKTGYTDLAGGNLGIVFDAGLGRPIAVVVLGSTEEARFTDVQKLARLAREAISLPE